MERRVFFICLLSFLLFAEGLSWIMAGGLGPCLVEPEHSEQAANNDNQHYCPTFLAGSLLSLERGFEWIKRDDNDKAVVAAFTVVLAISTIGLWLATNKLWAAGEKQFGLLSESAAAQARDMQESIRAATDYAKAANRAAEIAEQQLLLADRAWIDFQVANTGTLKFYADKCEIDLEVSIRNVGRTPAFKAKHEVEMFGNFQVALARHREMIRNASAVEFRTSGATVFPNEKITDEKWWWEVSRADFEAGSSQEENNKVGLYVVGLVVYQIPSSTEAKFTSFFKQIIRPGVQPFDTRKGTVYKMGDWKYLGTGFSEAS